MPNPLFDLLGGGMSNMPSNSFGNMIKQFQQFRQAFQGDPKQQVQELLNTGKMSQQQYNQLQAMATQFQKMMK